MYLYTYVCYYAILRWYKSEEKSLGEIDRSYGSVLGATAGACRRWVAEVNRVERMSAVSRKVSGEAEFRPMLSCSVSAVTMRGGSGATGQSSDGVAARK